MSATAASVTSNVATLTMAGNPITAGFTLSSTLFVYGFPGADAYFNGSFVISSLSSTQIKFTLTHANASASSTGNVVQQGATSSQACLPLVTLFTDPTGSVVASNPQISDGLGNVNFYTNPGVYAVQYYGQGVTTRIFTAVLAGTGEVFAVGMKCDGVTDNTAALQTVLNSTSASKVILPSGVCVINTGNVTVSIPDNIWLAGQGKFSSTLQRANGVNASGCMLTLSGTNGNATITDLTVDGNKANQTAGLRSLCSGGQTGNLQGLTIQRTKWANAYQLAIALLVGNGFYVNNVLIADNDFENNATGGSAVTDSNCTFGDIWVRAPQLVRVIRNRSTGADGNFACVQGNGQALSGQNIIANNVVTNANGFGTALGTTGQGVVVSGNTYNQPTARGNIVDIGTWTDVTIANNYILTGNACGGTCAGIGDNPPANRETIIGNLIIANSSSSFNNGISLGGSDVVINDNVVRNAGGTNISIAVNNATQAHGYVISNNVVKNGSQASSGSSPGISLFISTGGSGSLAGVVIKGNRIYDDQGSPTQGWGIGIAVAGQTTGFSDITIEGNDVRGNKTAGMTINTATVTQLAVRGNPGFDPLTEGIVDLTNQSANIGLTNAYVIPANMGGLYRVSVYAVVVTPAGVTSTLPTVNVLWVDRDSGGVQTAANVPLTPTGNSTTTFVQGTVMANITSGGGNAIAYSTTGYASNAAAAMKYALHIKIEFVQ